MDVEPTAQSESAVGGYDFHDPAFVTWWLNSLYLLPLEDQIAIAQRLLAAVHAPASRQEIEAFLELQWRELELQNRADASESSPGLAPETPAGWLLTFRQAWREKPWLTGIGVVAVAFFIGKGIWSLLRYPLGA